MSLGAGHVAHAPLFFVAARNRIHVSRVRAYVRHRLLQVLSWAILVSCSENAEAQPLAGRPPSPPDAAGESLGVRDRGIWSDLDGRVQLVAPTGPSTATVDAHNHLLIAWEGARPSKPYPLVPRGASLAAVALPPGLGFRPIDLGEVARIRSLATAPPSRHADHDRDGLPDPLDILIGARKTVINADAYHAGYSRLTYPLGDVPRNIGVCTDVVVRALRNAGIDLQVEVQQDIRRSRAAYPMVKGRGDSNIDHRRVKTLLPYFRRHWSSHQVSADDAADPYWPGDVVFMDTFPSRPGPDHIGIVSDRRSANGRPLIINNWTTGTVTAEMDLLPWVPVTHRFRVPPK